MNLHSSDQVQRSVRVRKHYSDDESESSGLEDEDAAQELKLIAIMRDLPQYAPSQTLLKALLANFSDKSLKKHDATFGAYLKTLLVDYNNVGSVLGTLLSIEDVSTMQLYAQLMQSEVTLQRNDKLCFSFALTKTLVNPEDVLAPYLDDVVLISKASLLAAPLPKHPILALLPHYHEDLPLKDPLCRYVASVEQVSRQTIRLKFKRSRMPSQLALAQRFYVILRSRRTPYRFMYRAMHLLQESPQLRRYLFPIVSPPAVPSSMYAILPKITLINESIASNIEQLQAVQHIVNGPSGKAPYIVFGPPGTGKTTTIVEAILQLRLQEPRSRILVTAGSNSACDTIAQKICEYFSVNERLQAHLAKQAKLSCLVTEDVKQDRQILRLFSRSIYAKGLKSVHPLLLKHSNCAKNIYDHMKVDALRKYGILVATLCTVGRLVTDNLGKFSFFTHVFIDEAGASTEPESLIGIMGIKQQDECHVILSGDHKQLGAVIKSNRAASLGLGHSLMERLLRSDLYAVDDNGNYDHTLQTRLRRNYRSHPEIVGLYNKLYYNGELIAEAPPSEINLAANWCLLPDANFPIIFQATHGATQREDHSTSSFNALEAQVLCWYVQRLLAYGLGGGVKVRQEDIGIVAPYVAQCRHISDKLGNMGYRDVEVGSVENYQGREKPIIIATLVRSFSSMGFMRNPRRINVLLSRAKSLLILIGNPVTLRYHRDIKFIINECKLHGNYLFKRKDGGQRPQFLSDMDDDEDEEVPATKQSNKPTLWCDEMPEDITVAVQEYNQQIVDSSSSSYSSNGNNSPGCRYSSGSSCPSTPPTPPAAAANAELHSEMAKLTLHKLAKQKLL